jgi:hypothetical protein
MGARVYDGGGTARTGRPPQRQSGRGPLDRARPKFPRSVCYFESFASSMMTGYA